MTLILVAISVFPKVEGATLCVNRDSAEKKTKISPTPTTKIGRFERLERLLLGIQLCRECTEQKSVYNLS